MALCSYDLQHYIGLSIDHFELSALYSKRCTVQLSAEHGENYTLVVEFNFDVYFDPIPKQYGRWTEDVPPPESDVIEV